MNLVVCLMLNWIFCAKSLKETRPNTEEIVTPISKL